MPAKKQHLLPVILGILGIVVVIGLQKLAALFLFEVSGAWNGDSPVYFAMGRGIINGLLPYRDLFEIKPPGIFLVSALSYFLTGTMSLGHWLQALVIAVIPFSIIIPVCLWTRARPFPQRLILLLGACIVGILFALYSDLEAGSFQTESFGACFAAFAVMMIACDTGKASTMRTAITALFLLIAVSFKEPFILAPGAAALLFARTPRDVLRTFLLPALLAGIVFILLLLVTGVFHDYLNNYLFFMTHVYLHRHGAMGLRGFSVIETVQDLWLFSPFLLASVVTLWTHAFIAGNHRSITKKEGIALACYALSVLTLFLLLNVLSRTLVLSFTPVTAMFFAGLTLASLCLMLRSASLLFADRHERWLRIFRSVSVWIALYLSLLSAGVSGDFFTHHFVCEMPVYVALFLFLMQLVTHTNASRVSLITCAVVITLSSLVLVLRPLPDLASALAWNHTQEQALQADADTIDRIMDACGWQRYLFVTSVPKLFIFGFTQHSPYGPIFTVFDYNTHYPQFHTSYLRNLADAHIAITTRDHQEIQTPDSAYIAGHFTTSVPACADGLRTTISDLLLFRKK